MKIAEILEIADKRTIDVAPEMEAKLRAMVDMLPEIEQLLIQHYHTSLEDDAQNALLKITKWRDE